MSRMSRRSDKTHRLPESELQAQALEWQVILWSGEVSVEERAGFERWLATGPAQRQAWQRIQQVSQAFETVPERLAGRVLRAPSADLGRRKLLLGLAAFGGAGLLGYGTTRTRAWRMATADYRTGTGERRSMTLPDGTALTLNTDTALDLFYTPSRRHLRLYRGEILVTTAMDPAPTPRPFSVGTYAGVVRPVGTRFSVRRLPGDGAGTRVQVFDGAVDLAPRWGMAMRLEAGQQADFRRRAVSVPAPVAATEAAWSQGRLVAEQQRLGDFIRNLDRYRPGRLRCDPAVADLVVSGVFPLDDTDAILQALAQALPVSVQSITDYWVTVTAS